MRELLEKTWAVSNMNELDIKRGLRTAAAAGLIGAAAAGIGYQKGITQKPIKKPIIAVEEPAKRLQVDVDKVAEIESNNNPKAENPKTGARGICQIMKSTWEEMTRKMGVDWPWEEAYNEEANKEVADYYMNTEIPRLLKYFGIEDTVENRLAAYNWGIGNLHKLGLSKAPQVTINYISKYKGL